MEQKAKLLKLIFKDYIFIQNWLVTLFYSVDRKVARKPLRFIHAAVGHNINDLRLLRDFLDTNSLHNMGNNRLYYQFQLREQFYLL